MKEIMESKTSARYGVIVPTLGYLLNTSLQKKLAFIEDPARASRTGSYEDTLQAKQLLDKVRIVHPTAEIVQYDTTVVARIIKPVEFDEILAAHLREYEQLHKLYTGMNANQVQQVPDSEWGHYQALKSQLVSVGLIK